jgi:hypothetical protein
MDPSCRPQAPLRWIDAARSPDGQPDEQHQQARKVIEIESTNDRDGITAEKLNEEASGAVDHERRRQTGSHARAPYLHQYSESHESRQGVVELGRVYRVEGFDV